MSRLLYVCAGSISGLTISQIALSKINQDYIRDHELLQSRIRTYGYMRHQEIVQGVFKHEIPYRACVFWNDDYITIDEACEQLAIINNKQSALLKYSLYDRVQKMIVN